MRLARRLSVDYSPEPYREGMLIRTMAPGGHTPGAPLRTRQQTKRSLGWAERLRLWFSYQRYAFILVVLPVGVVAALIGVAPSWWWLWGPVALVALKFVAFAVEVYGRWPRKMRATLLADRRIAAGRFRPEMVRRYCGDPCFRVVAREILRRAGVDRPTRQQLIRQFAAEEAERGHTLVMVDPAGGVRFEVDGHSIRRFPMSGEEPQATQQET